MSSIDPTPARTRAAAAPAGTHSIDLTDDQERMDESIGGLVAMTARDLGDLMRKEVELAKTELKEEAVAAGKAGGMLGAGGLVGYAALLLLLFAAAWGLSEVMPAGLAFLIVGVVTAAVAAVLVITGKNRLTEISPAPQTIETLQEDVQWAKQQLS